MTDRIDLPPEPKGFRRLSYTCRYGFVDLGHALPGRPNDPNSLAALHRQLTMVPPLSSHPQPDPRAQLWGKLPFGHAPMQDKPVALGYLEARQADGLIGRSKSATLDAIEAFQRRNGLKTDRDLGGRHSQTRHRLAMPAAKLVRAI